jgi:hypothetical protein
MALKSIKRFNLSIDGVSSSYKAIKESYARRVTFSKTFKFFLLLQYFVRSSLHGNRKFSLFFLARDLSEQNFPLCDAGISKQAEENKNFSQTANENDLFRHSRIELIHITSL